MRRLSDQRDDSKSDAKDGPRVHVRYTSRTTAVPLPGIVALLVIAPLLLVVGVVTLGIVVAGVSGALLAPRVLRRGHTGGPANDRRPTITLEPGDYRRMD